MFSQTVDCGVYYDRQKDVHLLQELLYVCRLSLWRTVSHVLNQPGSIERFIEGHAFFNLINFMIRLQVHPLPPSLQSVSSTGNTQEDWERETTCKRKRGGKGGGEGRGAQSYDSKKAWPSINHSIPSVLNTWQTGPRVADTGSSSQW